MTQTHDEIMAEAEQLGADPIAVKRLGRDLRRASSTLTKTEARFLVDSYYDMQETRKQSSNRVRALGDAGEPHEVVQWLLAQSSTLEQQIKASLDVYSYNDPVGEWARSIKGIGPVLAAGLLAHIDIKRSPTVGHIWRFSGQDPTCIWEKGQKRPFNAKLKTLCWKIGKCFVYVSSNEKSFYGQLYKKRKEYEIERNEAGELADQAAEGAKRVRKETEAYKHYIKGKLPPAHIQRRSERYAVKLFLAHYHEVAYKLHFGEDPPLPYPIAHLGHAHKIEVPVPPSYV